MISTHAVWIGIAAILFGLAFVVTYEYQQWLKRKPRATVDATPGSARSTGASLMDDDDRALSESRWHKAQAFLDGVGDAEEQRTLRRQAYRRQLLLVGAIGVPVAVLAVLIALSHRSGGRAAEGPEVALWREILGFSLQALGLALAGVGLVRSKQARRSLAAGTPLIFLNRGERKQLLREVRGGLDTVPSQLPLARDLAVRLTLKSSPLIASAFVLLFIGQVLIEYQSWYSFYAAVCVLLFVWTALSQRRDLARARRFLAEHPSPPVQQSQVPTN